MRNLSVRFLWLAALAFSAATDASADDYTVYNESSYTVRASQGNWRGEAVDRGAKSPTYTAGPIGELAVEKLEGGKWELFCPFTFYGWHVMDVYATDTGCICHAFAVENRSAQREQTTCGRLD